MKKYKIEKFLKDDYDKPRYAIIYLKGRYIIAFEDDYGVQFNNGYVEDHAGIYSKKFNQETKLIKKTETPKKDWDDMMKIIEFIIDKMGQYEFIIYDDEFSNDKYLSISLDRFLELNDKYNICSQPDWNCEDIMDEELNKLDPDDMHYDDEYDEIVEKYSSDEGINYLICADVISDFYFKIRRKFNKNERDVK